MNRYKYYCIHEIKTITTDLENVRMVFSRAMDSREVGYGAETL